MQKCLFKDIIDHLTYTEAQELLKETAARQSAVITDSLSWPSLDHPQANHDGVFARIVHLVDHDEDQLCCGMA
ncbi:hypothetical protein DPMN_054773 [Dreissena polymorpha]|uniref:Uncharacterized protein n=1 Tax=Dreissena polymorpha TaxID=45954 RepID=A0A9D4CRD7_DREPO|nr:hypothetical protein DPMN_054773 [Dreissena polymorpha]